MSDDDLEGAPFNEWFDSEADLPNISSVSIILYMGVNVSSPSANTQHVKALEFKDSSAMNSAPNKGNSVGDTPLEEKGPDKGDDLLDSSIHTPLTASPHHLFRATVGGPWVEEEGWTRWL